MKDVTPENFEGERDYATKNQQTSDSKTTFFSSANFLDTVRAVPKYEKEVKISPCPKMKNMTN